MKHRLATLLVAGSVGAIVALPAAAAADDPAPVSGVLVDSQTVEAGQAVHLEGLFPTATHVAVLLLDGDARANARRMEISVTELRDLEHGCNRPERHGNDASCDSGPDAGELSDFLEVRLAPGRESGDSDSPSCTPLATVATTSLAELIDGPVVVGLPDENDVLCVVATFEHLSRAGDNVTQTDSVSFDLRLRFDQTPVAAPEIAGASQVRGEVIRTEIIEGPVVMGLPATGMSTPISALLVISGALLGSGGYFAARRGRVRAEEVTHHE